MKEKLKSTTRKTQRTQTPSKIYLVSCGKYIRLGVAKNIAKQLNALQLDNPETVEVIHQVYGSPVEERAIHELIKSQVHVGKWYPKRLKYRIIKLMNELRK